jgi:GNAT superfamily N-acetyltransferase
MQSGFDSAMGWTKPAGYFAHCCQLHADGHMVLLVAIDGNHYAGHVKVMWTSAYAHFRDQGIPEIQDLAVLPAYRRQGVASQLLDAAEALIQERSTRAGIGFGLYADYGPAQRMYILRGYVPDGNGVSYNDLTVQPGTQVTVDDDLVLYLVKTLRE